MKVGDGYKRRKLIGLRTMRKWVQHKEKMQNKNSVLKNGLTYNLIRSYMGLGWPIFLEVQKTLYVPTFFNIEEIVMAFLDSCVPKIIL